ncbi:hypothetical protein HPB49_016312 [Dermacentor silvarum]|uniref:Uncharacterized protein n=1 Tax=Dermacentor silvarum TaxID=543639 RepID=A0ACB8CLW6_DERSI|nr:hypothetical protein HPB49_016312 [Dermacentor silvarum]
MMPVVRNDYDIYNRSRRTSPEHSNSGSLMGSTSLSTSPNVRGSSEDVCKMYRSHEHLDCAPSTQAKVWIAVVNQEVPPSASGYPEACRASQQPRPRGDGGVAFHFWMCHKRTGQGTS